MLNKKTLLSFFILFLFLLVNFSVVTSEYTINDSELLAVYETRNFHVNAVAELPNGDLYVVHQNSSDHSGFEPDPGYRVTAHRSTDGGATWVQDQSWLGYAGANIGVMPNGTVFVALKCWGADYIGTKYMLSYDNATTFTTPQWFGGSANDFYMHTSTINYDNETEQVFIPVCKTDANGRWIYNSSDNGKTWNVWSTVTTSHSRWYTTMTKMENGTWLLYAFAMSECFYYWSEDSCQTWSDGTEITSSDVFIRQPQLYMGDIDHKNPYILFGRDWTDGLPDDDTDSFAIYNSSDGVHWSNRTLVTKIVGSGAAYSSGTYLRNGTFFITHSDPYDYYVGGTPITQLNYTTISNFGHPNYEIFPWNPLSEEPSIAFQSINNQENNTVTTDVISSFNWTKVDNASYYTLSASNNSDMSSPIYNITIHTSDSNCWDNSTGYIEYVLPEAYRTTWNKYYYYQVSAYHA